MITTKQKYQREPLSMNTLPADTKKKASKIVHDAVKQIIICSDSCTGEELEHCFMWLQLVANAASIIKNCGGHVYGRLILCTVYIRQYF